MKAKRATRVRSIIPQLLTGRASTLTCVLSFVRESGVGGVNGFGIMLLVLRTSSTSLLSCFWVADVSVMTISSVTSRFVCCSFCFLTSSLMVSGEEKDPQSMKNCLQLSFLVTLLKDITTARCGFTVNIFFCSDSLKTTQVKILGYYEREPPNVFTGNERKIEPTEPD